MTTRTIPRDDSVTKCVCAESKRSSVYIKALSKSQKMKATMCPYRTSLGLSRSLAVAADDLDLVCHNLLCILHLERNVFDQECPYLVAEAVGIKMTLLGYN